MFNFLKIIACKEYIINIDKDCSKRSTFIFGEKGVIGFWLLITGFLNDNGKGRELVSWCLFETVEGFIKPTGKILPLSAKTRWRFHVYYLL